MPTFDAYYKWLGIPPAESAAGVLNHYRLLGISLFEADAEAIASAADQRMAHLRTLQTGPHSEQSQTLLNQIATAKLCLLAPDKKTSYDAELRRKLESNAARSTPVADGRLQPRTPLRIAARLDAASTATNSADSAAEPNAIELGSLGFDPATQRATKKSRSRAKPGRGPLAFWAPLAAVMAVLVAIWIASQSDSGFSPNLAAKDGGETRQPRAAERAVQATDHPTAVGNIQPRPYPSAPSTGIRENSDAPQPEPARTENDPASSTTQPERIPQPPDNRVASAAGLMKQEPAAKNDRKPSGTAPYPGGYKPPPNSSRGKSTPLPDNAFVVSLAQDNAGRIWVGTEDFGVFRYDPSAGESARWTEFTTNEGLGDDNAYALCVDRLNRIWVGHLNHGVSVFNGQSWVNYDVLDGPIGERVFSIAADPVSGDVWIGTSAGLTRYSLGKDNWTHYTRDDGLPSDQIQSLAFDGRGTLYAGTQCDGLAIADAAHDYRRWRQISGSDALPLGPSGPGLPSNLINDVLVSRSGAVFVATTCGLAASKDRGKSWAFIRGKDWGAKVKGLYGGPPRGWREGPAPLLLTEDYCTRLAEDDSGLLWIGHRQTGCEAIDPARGQASGEAGKGLGAGGEGRGEATKKKDDKRKNSPDYVMALLALRGHEPLVGWYGDGLSIPSDLAAVSNHRGSGVLSLSNNQSGKIPPLPARHPTPAAPPTLDELNSLLAKLATVPTLRQLTPTVVELADDWRTQGDWLGRYGRYWACLCSTRNPGDMLWGAWPKPVGYDAQIGPNHPDKRDAMRYWVHRLYSDDHRSLEMPPTYLQSQVIKGLTTPDRNRRQAEWDDHGEAYSQSLDGPDVVCTLEIPPGQFYLSLYDFNKDGHEASNRFRDYRISIWPHEARLSVYRLDDLPREPEWARGRIHDFWGGVWKRFYVQGPVDVSIQVRKNSSLNTILAGVMLDYVDEEPAPYFHSPDEWARFLAGMGALRKGLQSESTSVRADRFNAGREIGAVADRLFGELELMRVWNTPWWASKSRPFYAALSRWYRCDPPPTERASARDEQAATAEQRNARLSACDYQMRFFEKWEGVRRAGGRAAARDIEKGLVWNEAAAEYGGAGDYNDVLERLQPTNILRPPLVLVPITIERGSK